MNESPSLTWRQWRDPAVFVVCGFGSGFVGRAPGTWGSALAVVIWWFALAPLSLTGQLVVIGATTALGTWLIGRVRTRYGVTDPGAIVIDEFAGQWIVLLMIPANVWWVLAGFGLFRLFDIWKPFPVGYLERHVSGAFGVMVDDLAAGIMGLAVLQFTLWGYHTF